MNRCIEEVLRQHVSYNQADWDQHIQVAAFAINNSYQASTRTTPFMLNHGRNPRLPSALTELTDQLEKRFVMVAGRKAQAALRFTQRMQEDIRQAKGYLKIAQQRMKAYSDIGKKERTFQVGDKVLLSTRNLKLKNDERTTARAKLQPKFIGPYEVTQVVGKVAYKIEQPGHCRLHPVFHVSLLFPYNDLGKFPGAQASPQPLDC